MKILSRNEMKKIMAGSCTQTYTGCNGTSGGGATCDYHIVCTNGYTDNLCGMQCQNPGDGNSCIPPAQP